MLLSALIKFRLFFKDHPAILPACHILALWQLAVSEPVFNIFTADRVLYTILYHLGPPDYLLLAVAVALLPPLLILLAYSLFLKFAGKITSAFYLLVISLLLTMVYLPILKHHTEISGYFSLFLAMGLSVGSIYLLHRLSMLRAFFSLLSPVALFIPLLFLWNSWLMLAPAPLHTALQAGNLHSDEKNIVLSHGSRVPIILIVFDEFPVSSLMNGSGKIDAVQYPHFADLADHANWFPRVNTVHSVTYGAIPAILTGNYPPSVRKGARQFCTTPLPVRESFPNNLYTWLKASYHYRLSVFDNLIRLAPPDDPYPNEPRHLLRQPIQAVVAASVHRYGRMLAELSKSYFHWMLSDFVWGDILEALHPFIQDRLTHAPDFALLREFYQAIDSHASHSDQASMYALHVLLPHAMWEYYPSGKAYHKWPVIDSSVTQCDFTNARKICANAWRAEVLYQRHLLQVGYTDKILGEILAHLKAKGLYDPALIVVTADHGASFQPGEMRRGLSLRNAADIMRVPLFIKLPYQQEGKIDWRDAESVDIVPTIADALKMDLSWRSDGVSLLGSPVVRASHPVCSPTERWMMRPEPIEALQQLTINRKAAMFGEGAAQNKQIFEVGDYHHLVGVPQSQLNIAGVSKLKAVVVQPDAFHTVRTDQLFLPMPLHGRLLLVGERTRIPLAVGLNGVIQAVSTSYELPGSDERRFRILLPEKVFRNGDNRLALFEIAGPADHPVFYQLHGNYESASRK